MKRNLKSKKFNAAEKHFKKKEAVLQAKIKCLQDQSWTQRDIIDFLREQNNDLKKQIEELKLTNAALIKLKTLTDDELNLMIERNKVLLAINETLQNMKFFSPGGF